MVPMNADDMSTLMRSVTMCALAAICVIALCATLFFKVYADPTILVTIVAATNLLLGYLAGKRAPAAETETKPKPTEPKET
jgi:predicted Co/Zn/Cd cation transporter (cation efflux family)